MNLFLPKAHRLSKELSAIKDLLHRRPELSFEETETTAYIKEKLRALNLEVIDLGMPTGAVALLRGGKPGPLVALRADIDAIAETETANAEVCSQTPGVMHACGHDLHTACLLGAAALLCGVRGQLPGDVAFIFQPAEEVTQGAREMLRHGLLNKLPRRPCGMFGLHSWGMKTGFVGARHGGVAAGKTNFRIILKGRGGQGGFPHECVDVIVAGAAIINGIQTVVSRNADPRSPLVCAVYSVHAGKEEFFVTDALTLSGSVRALSRDVLSMAEGRLKELTRSISKAYGCAGRLQLMPQTPPLINAAELFDIAAAAAGRVARPDCITQPPPMLGSDDFAVYGEEMPVFYYQLGVMDQKGEDIPLHRPDFKTDNGALPIGSALLAEAARVALENWTNGGNLEDSNL